MKDPAIKAFESLIGETVLACSILGGMNKIGSALTKRHYYYWDWNTQTYVKERR